MPTEEWITLLTKEGLNYATNKEWTLESGNYDINNPLVMKVFVERLSNLRKAVAKAFPDEANLVRVVPSLHSPLFLEIYVATKAKIILDAYKLIWSKKKKK